ncbi:MAG: ribonuclease D [Cellvibrionaceae bacterium]|jgi:ribonuclease D
MSTPAEWIDGNQRLAELCEQWQQQDVIALDTEFIRTRTFFPKIGLLQIADAHGIYLVDPLAMEQFDPLKQVLLNANVVKIIHSCSEDLEVFEHFFSVLPQPLFDTQIAAAFAGKGSSISYANLIKEMRGDIIPKQETRSDWLQRPLSQSQLEYAALDVEYLIETYHTLVDELTQQQRLDWVKKECQQCINKILDSDNFNQYYRKVKSAWRLKPKQLAVLRGLCEWREKESREIDIPRNHLVKDSTLLEMARVLPKETLQFYKLRDMQPKFVDHYGEECLYIVETAQSNVDNYPEALPAPLTASQNQLFRSLKEVVVSTAESLSIPPEFLARKKDLEALVHHSEDTTITLPKGLQDWREVVIGKLLLERLAVEG